MKGPLNLDRARHDFGAATATVLAILDEWEAIDWFVPTSQPESSGHLHFVQHQRLCMRHAPNAFPQPIKVQHRQGGWPEFVACCQAVRAVDAGDWKFGPLKSMALDHGRRYGYSLQQIAAKILKPGSMLDLRCLFMASNGHVFWGHLGPFLDFRSLGSRYAESASFYFGYAHGDAMDAIEWQLAEPDAPLVDNPFVALLHCYSSGYYPFVHKDGRVVLFRFDDR